MSREKIDNLLDHLYLASADPSAWPEFLRAAATLFEATVCGFIVQPQNDMHYSITTISGMDQQDIDRYNAYYCTTDPWNIGLQRLGKREWIGPGSALCPPSQIKNSEFYNDFWKHSASTLYQAGNIFQSRGSSVVFTMHRDRTQDDFDDEETRLLREIHPHLRRAVSVHQTVSDLRQSLTSVGGVVDAIDLGLIGLRHDRTVCFTNAAAEEIFRSGEVLSIRNGKLSCCESNSTEALNELIKNASGRKLGALSGGSLTVSNSLRSLYLTVFPTPGPRGIIPDPAKVFLTITDPAAPPKSREQLLVKLFRLTPSEARVVMLFLSGLGPEEIAKQRQTTPGTVRFQLKAIYRKMGVTRQSQLVRLASRLPGIR